MFDRMTDQSRRVLVVAQYQAEQFGRPKIGTEHVLLGLAIEANGVAGDILRYFGIQESLVHQAIVDHVEAQSHDGKLLFTPNAVNALNLALREAIKIGGKQLEIDTEHVLLGILRQAGSSATRVLEAMSINQHKLLAVTLWAASGVESEVAVMVRTGRFEAAFTLLQQEMDEAEAVLERARALRDQVASAAASNVA